MFARGDVQRLPQNIDRRMEDLFTLMAPAGYSWYVWLLFPRSFHEFMLNPFAEKKFKRVQPRAYIPRTDATATEREQNVSPSVSLPQPSAAHNWSRRSSGENIFT